jgi:hypothetical protein
MSMQNRVDDYLAMRRSLGFKLHGEGRMLAGFATRLDDAGQASITISAALALATESQQAAPAWSQAPCSPAPVRSRTSSTSSAQHRSRSVSKRRW